MVQTSEIILASSSPRRRELLHNLGLSFTIMTSDVDESTEPEMSPTQIVETLSLRKAEKIVEQVESGIVIGSDTIVVLDQKVLGKPQNEDDAFLMLSALQGREHTVYSGVALVDAASGHKEVGVSQTQVKMRSLTEQEIRSYIASGEPQDKAGSYAIQGIGATIIEGIVGDYFTVVGLPLHLTAQLFKKFDIALL